MSKDDLHDCVRQYIVIRKAKGITQEEVADKLGVSMSTIGKVETGARIPSVPMMGMLCFAVGAKLGVIDF